MIARTTPRVAAVALVALGIVSLRVRQAAACGQTPPAWWVFDGPILAGELPAPQAVVMKVRPIGTFPRTSHELIYAGGLGSLRVTVTAEGDPVEIPGKLVPFGGTEAPAVVWQPETPLPLGGRYQVRAAIENAASRPTEATGGVTGEASFTVSSTVLPPLTMLGQLAVVIEPGPPPPLDHGPCTAMIPRALRPNLRARVTVPAAAGGFAAAGYDLVTAVALDEPFDFSRSKGQLTEYEQRRLASGAGTEVLLPLPGSEGPFNACFSAQARDAAGNTAEIAPACFFVSADGRLTRQVGASGCSFAGSSAPAPLAFLALLSLLLFARRRSRWLALVLATGCSEAALPPGTPDPERPPLSAEELRRTFVELPAPHAIEVPRVIRTPGGFLALAREFYPGGKVLSEIFNYLYESRDGVSWRRLPLPAKPATFGLRDIAYGSGRYAMVGSGGGAGNRILVSRDLAVWSERAIALPDPAQFAHLVYTGGRFLALATGRQVAVSLDGSRWDLGTLENVQPTDVAFGNDRFVLVGSGPVEVSRDGRTWQPAPLDCALPRACIQDPGGGIHQGFHSRVIYAARRFYMDELVSSDGVDWRAHDEPLARAVIGDTLFGSPRTGSGWVAWIPGGPTAPVGIFPSTRPGTLAQGIGADTIATPLPGGETCLSHRCELIDGRLYLLR